MSNNTGNRNTGNLNAGNLNAGDCNAGNRNAGNRNAGNLNAGNRNAGNLNAGNRNAGNRNTGSWNAGNRNTGYFNLKTPSKINVFDVECDKSDWDDCDKPDFIYFNLTEWVPESEMSEKEKESHKETYRNCGGYLKELDYKEAFKASYNKAPEEDRKKIFNIPNFDADKFLEISGIDVRVDNELEQKKKALIEKANELLRQAEEL